MLEWSWLYNDNMGKIKSFRGILGDNEQQRIHLAGGDSDTGYKIHKLQGITKEPFQTDGEHVIKVYKVKQSSVTDTVDLSDETLLGVVTFMMQLLQVLIILHKQ